MRHKTKANVMSYKVKDTPNSNTLRKLFDNAVQKLKGYLYNIRAIGERFKLI